MYLWTALILGLVSSLHCAGMCGPLMLALPVANNGSSSLSLGAYNLGRVLTYGLLGTICGLIGHSLSFAGVQRWLSLGAGGAILVGLALSSRYPVSAPVTQATALLKAAFARTLQKRTHASFLLLGSFNGLLPCGMVYAACAGAVASGRFLGGAEYMLAFGAGTLPMMLGMGLAGKRLEIAIRFKFRQLVPLSVLVLGILLIFRGLELGIPYLSPRGCDGQPNCCSPHF